MLVRLGQEVQEVPRRVSAGQRLSKPDPPLADDDIRLEPLAQRHALPLLAIVAGDDDVFRFTRVPQNPDEGFVRSWIRRYEEGWANGSCAGFAIEDGDGTVLGFASAVQLDLPAGEAELGYLVDRRARGRGIATRSVALLTRWAFDGLGLERLELLIQPENTGSERVAERAGYRREGVLRSKHIRDGRRADFGVWSRLRTE
jgi:RimJ/RimL family protein N-acetyltransferase